MVRRFLVATLTIATVTFCGQTPARGAAWCVLSNVRVARMALSPKGETLLVQLVDLPSSPLLEGDRIEVNSRLLFIALPRGKILQPPVAEFFRWSFDGSRIAFTREGSLWIAEADGTKAEQFKSPEDGPPNSTLADYRWSPDGRSIALFWAQNVGSKSESYSVKSLDLASSESRDLANGPGQVEGVSWAPNGKSLAYLERRYAFEDLPYVERVQEVSLRGIVTTLLDNARNSLGVIDGLAYSPNGDLLLAGILPAMKGNAIWLVNGVRASTKFDPKQLRSLGLRLHGSSLHHFTIASATRRLVVAEFRGHGAFDVWVADFE